MADRENDRLRALLWRVVSADSVYVDRRLFVDVGDALWNEIADAVGYDEQGQ